MRGPARSPLVLSRDTAPAFTPENKMSAHNTFSFSPTPSFLNRRRSKVRYETRVVWRNTPLISFAKMTLNPRTLLTLLDSMTAPAQRLPVRSRSWTEDGKAQAARGDQITAWLIDHGFAKSDDAAFVIANDLVRSRGLVALQRVESSGRAFEANKNSYYAHYSLSVATSHGGLNSFTPGQLVPEPRGTFAILLELSTHFANLVADVTIRDGMSVVYPNIRTSKHWPSILLCLSELAHSAIDEQVIDESVKKACLFNLYNLMIIHGKLVYGHPKDITARRRFFERCAYVIAGHRLNSIELEHGVLRLKMPDYHPLAGLRPIEKDARMHFILNCGAKSCPPLVPLHPTKSEQVLRDATTDFIRHNVKIDAVEKIVILSRLWKWFRIDFTPEEQDSDAALMAWIGDRAPGNIRDLVDLLATELKRGEVKLRFDVYDWGDNSGPEKTPSDTAFMFLYDASFRNSA